MRIRITYFFVAWALFSAGGISAGVRETPSSGVEIISFRRAGGVRSFACEICGKVTGSEVAGQWIKIIVDPNSSRSRTYRAYGGSDGNFCLVVVTFSGTAEAQLETALVSEIPALYYVTSP